MATATAPLPGVATKRSEQLRESEIPGVSKRGDMLQKATPAVGKIVQKWQSLQYAAGCTAHPSMVRKSR
jgi:hypothetical protein